MLFDLTGSEPGPLHVLNLPNEVIERCICFAAQGDLQLLSMSSHTCSKLAFESPQWAKIEMADWPFWKLCKATGHGFRIFGNQGFEPHMFGMISNCSDNDIKDALRRPIRVHHFSVNSPHLTDLLLVADSKGTSLMDVDY